MTDKTIPIVPLPQISSRIQPASGSRGNKNSGPSFDSVLHGEMASGHIKFSRHALDRMQNRGIQISPERMQRLETAVDALRGKGSRDSLVLLDQTAMVVSIKNQTVVTVVDQQQLKGNVFTNIDSAIIA